MMGNGRMVKEMALGHFVLKMDKFMRVIGMTIRLMEWARKYGMMEENMKDNMTKAKKMERDNFNGLVAVNLKECIKITKLMVRVDMNGQTAVFMMENG